MSKLTCRALGLFPGEQVKRTIYVILDGKDHRSEVYIGSAVGLVRRINKLYRALDAQMNSGCLNGLFRLHCCTAHTLEE